MSKIKICGVTRAADAVAAAEEGADYVGLIFARSARKVDIRAAQDGPPDLGRWVAPARLEGLADTGYQRGQKRRSWRDAR